MCPDDAGNNSTSLHAYSNSQRFCKVGGVFLETFEGRERKLRHLLAVRWRGNWDAARNHVAVANRLYFLELLLQHEFVEPTKHFIKNAHNLAWPNLTGQRCETHNVSEETRNLGEGLRDY